ncbi:hypothetical protein HZS_1799 [Henneguya salminicola]|nr:hypothetical protein HZS_1799 [Henneguya salminicola]
MSYNFILLYCSKVGKDNYKARLIVSNRNIVARGEHVCKIRTITQSEDALVEITPEMHKNKFIDDKSDQLNI